MKDDALRLFFAIPLNEHLKKQVLNDLEWLKKNCSIPVRWSKEANLHLTLSFLGHVNPQQLDQLYEAVQYLEEVPTFDLRLQGLIAFPTQKPRIIGIDIELSHELASLVNDLQAHLKRYGFEQEERTFIPHITLGRITKPRRRMLCIESQRLPRSQHVSQVSLFHSQLTPEGSIYMVLKEFLLKECVSQCQD